MVVSYVEMSHGKSSHVEPHETHGFYTHFGPVARLQAQELHALRQQLQVGLVDVDGRSTYQDGAP